MGHIDEETLALFALGDVSLGAGDRRHLDTCAACAWETDTLRRTVETARAAQTIVVATPSEAVWAGVQNALGFSDDVTPSRRVASTPTGERAADEHSAGLSASATTSRADEHPETDAPAGVVGERAALADLATHRARRKADRRPTTSGRSGAPRRWPIVAWASAAAVVGVIAGALGTTWTTSQGSAPESVVARATLDAFPGWEGARGDARLEEEPGGRRVVAVDLDAPRVPGEIREVWLIRADATGLVSIGLLDGSTGRFTIPDGLDLTQYPLVDISAEPDNGDPSHSGDSIVRGEFQRS